MKAIEAKIILINIFGLASIQFSRDMRLVPDLSFINNGTIYLDELDVAARQLIVKTYSNERQRIPVLQVNVIAGQDQNEANIKFSWNVTVQNNRTLDIQVYFATPNMIS